MTNKPDTEKCGLDVPLHYKIGESDSTAGLVAVHCPNCPDQGYTIYETGGIDMDGENDTREGHQEQCQFCYETPNSVFNIARAAEVDSALASMQSDIDWYKAHLAQAWDRLQEFRVAHDILKIELAEVKAQRDLLLERLRETDKCLADVATGNGRWA